MAETIQLEGFAEDIGSPENVHALGVASLRFNRVETSFRVLFMEVTKSTWEFSSLFFPKMGADARMKVLEKACSIFEYDIVLVDYLRHYFNGYKICALNRHGLMHSEMAGTSGVDGQEPRSRLHKMDRSGSRLFTDLKLSDIRTAADDMLRWERYGQRLSSVFWAANRGPFPEPDPGEPLITLPEKPPLPTSLGWNKEPRLPKPSLPQQSFGE